jgi:hypothetical protein
LSDYVRFRVESGRYSHKYYVAYKLMTDMDEAQRKAREALQPGK